MTSTFEIHRHRLDSHRRALEAGLTDADVVDAIRRLDAAVAEVDGHGFAPTPLTEEDELAAAVGVPGPLLVKDETGNVSGSHKGRHLFGVALDHLLARSSGTRNADERYAIASCGNAALAAAVVARALDHPLDVYVPTWANPAVTETIESLGATVVRVARNDGELGDPSHRAFVEALDSGAVGFSCQGTETPTTIDGGRTLAYEVLDQQSSILGDGRTIGRVFVQVGGGALATAIVTGLAAVLGTEHLPRVHVVQPRGNHPLVRAWDRLMVDLGHEQPGDNPARAHVADEVGAMSTGDTRAVLARVAGDPQRYMQPWPTEPESYATGILDDVTYDWMAPVEAMLSTAGFPIVAEEEHLRHSHLLARRHTDIDVCPTGAAGLGGVVAGLDDGSLSLGDEAVLVLFTGHTRPGDPTPA